MATLVVRVRARAEFDEAFEWYRTRSPDAARESLDAVDVALTHITESPAGWRR